jgi:hypothetical protein
LLQIQQEPTEVMLLMFIKLRDLAKILR